MNFICSPTPTPTYQFHYSPLWPSLITLNLVLKLQMSHFFFYFHLMLSYLKYHIDSNVKQLTLSSLSLGLSVCLRSVSVCVCLLLSVSVSISVSFPVSLFHIHMHRLKYGLANKKWLLVWASYSFQIFLCTTHLFVASNISMLLLISKVVCAKKFISLWEINYTVMTNYLCLLIWARPLYTVNIIKIIRFLASQHRSGENLIILHKQDKMIVGPIW